MWGRRGNTGWPGPCCHQAQTKRVPKKGAINGIAGIKPLSPVNFHLNLSVVNPRPSNPKPSTPSPKPDT